MYMDVTFQNFQANTESQNRYNMRQRSYKTNSNSDDSYGRSSQERPPNELLKPACTPFRKVNNKRELSSVSTVEPQSVKRDVYKFEESPMGAPMTRPVRTYQRTNTSFTPKAWYTLTCTLNFPQYEKSCSEASLIWTPLIWIIHLSGHMFGNQL